MHLIVVDIGNSAVKLALCDRSPRGTKFTLSQRWVEPLDQDLIPFFDSLKLAPARWLISSVHQYRTKQISDLVSAYRPSDNVVLISDVPIQSSVTEPKKVGRDRLLAGLAAMHLPFPNPASDWIVVDAGTAVTVDWINDKLGFCGGNIFPGADSSFRQLFAETDALPDLEYTGRVRHLESMNQATMRFGSDTISAILSGVYHAQIGAVCHHIAGLYGIIHERDDRSKVGVVVTGGGWTELSLACTRLTGDSLAKTVMRDVSNTASLVEDPELVWKGIALADQQVSD